MLARTIRPTLMLDEIQFLAWVDQASGGDRLEYHRGFMAVDTDKQMSMLPADERRLLCGLADAAFRAAMQDLIHLVQTRLGSDHFAYIAIARPRRQGAPAFPASRLLDAQAA
jgi:hypothetical protein